MEAAGLAFSVAQTLFAALQCSELKELFSMFGYKDELARLQSTVDTIKDVLLDADAKGELSRQQQGFIEKLKDAVYDADDLFDEFTTVAVQQQHLLSNEEGRKFPLKKLRRLFSHFEKMGAAYKMSKEVKKIRKKLDGIADDATKFSFKVDYQPILRRREETCSYVHDESVIGRDDDVNSVISKLLDPNTQGNVSVLSIVGMGGIGKTTLAQLVFNDARVKDEFPLRLWTCVADQDQKHLDVKAILGNILESATNGSYNNHLGIQQLQKEVRQKLEGNKYLLVLDDVWTENRLAWEKLETHLLGGQSGSRVVVTTRSKETAETAIRSGVTYELQGLSDENSWRLFEVAAGQEQANCPDLVEIARAIVKKCANVPLAIKVVGSLLHGQAEDKWRSFQKSRITAIRKDKNDVESILKFSYYHLSPSLKSCFSYCALFPKDFRIDKEMLISVWIAQGFIEEPLGEGQNIEDAAEEHFQILLRRCFFQDVTNDEFGEIVSCKIHDLMHDVAQEVAGKEISQLDVTIRGLDEKTRHVLYVSQDFKESLFTKTKIRTYLSYNILLFLPMHNKFLLSALVPNFMYLRVLHLSGLDVTTVPEKIGKLLHLRYLDLSGNSALEILPESITELHNLQTLLLSGCFRLKELPNDFGKLVNLRVLDLKYCGRLTHLPPGMSKLTRLKALDIKGCHGLTCLPSGMSKLTRLTRLNMFVMSGTQSDIRRLVAGIEELTPLKNLRRKLQIYFGNGYAYVKEKDVREGYLSNKKHLTHIRIEWKGSSNEEEDLLEDLQPHSNLKVLELYGYYGVRIPKWARQDNLGIYLPNLVEIDLHNCFGLRELPWLGKLHFLKSITLCNLSSLEYMESTSFSVNYGASAPTSVAPGGANSLKAAEVDSSFFPSLEKLTLSNLAELKGWWRGSGSGGSQPLELPSFPRLSKLHILYCPNLTSMPLCPTVEDLEIGKCNERLRIMGPDEEGEVHGSCCSLLSQPMSGMLRKVRVDDVEHLKSLPHRDFHCFSEMTIEGDNKVEGLSEYGEVLRSCSSSLRKLCINKCSKLRRVWRGGLEHLTALEVLSLCGLPELKWNEEEEDDDLQMQSWICFAHTLRELRLWDLPKLEKLPKGMRHLTSLQYLWIDYCRKVESIPHWIGCLSSLRFLQFWECEQLKSLPASMRELTSLQTLGLIRCSEELKERCREPDGECWPFIQHIPNITLN